MATKLLEQQFESLLSQCAHELNQGREWRAKNLISSWSGKHGVRVGFTPVRRNHTARLELKCAIGAGVIEKEDGQEWRAVMCEVHDPSRYPDFFKAFGFGTGGLLIDILRRITEDAVF